jgi:hypothetical protein
MFKAGEFMSVKAVFSSILWLIALFIMIYAVMGWSTIAYLVEYNLI